MAALLPGINRCPSVQLPAEAPLLPHCHICVVLLLHGLPSVFKTAAAAKLKHAHLLLYCLCRSKEQSRQRKGGPTILRQSQQVHQTCCEASQPSAGQASLRLSMSKSQILIKQAPGAFHSLVDSFLFWDLLQGLHWHPQSQQWPAQH